LSLASNLRCRLTCARCGVQALDVTGALGDPGAVSPASTLGASPTPRADGVTAAMIEPLSGTLDLIRRGSHPLDLYPVGGLYELLVGPLGHVVAAGWAAHGHKTRYSTHSVTEGQSARTQTQSLELFTEAIKLVPIIEPACWIDEDGRTPPLHTGAHATCAPWALFAVLASCAQVSGNCDRPSH
jgi:hypothetical protein